MSDAGGDAPPVVQSAIVNDAGHTTAHEGILPVEKKIGREGLASPILAPGTNPLVRQPTSLDLDDYFKGPRDIDRHSKWPLFLRVHGSILPKMIVPLLWVGGWATCITLISKYVHDLSVSSVLLTITGFVVGLGLSFRGSTAYERYSEGRKYWAQVMLASQNLGRIFWVHSKERDPEKKKHHLLHAMTASNLVVAFALALKHKLRFQPYTGYEDINQLVAHLHTFAGTATRADPSKSVIPKKTWFKEMGEYLGLSFAASNPRKLLKKADAPIGNLPLEILNYLGAYLDKLIADGKLNVSIQQTIAFNNLASFNDALIGTDRVLSTPLPIAYTIAFSQITWVYVMLLPFQLYATLDWVTIPATLAASYIILGLLFIGREIENPFGEDVNDLPLESYCEQIANNMDIIAAQSLELENLLSHVEGSDNLVLFPSSSVPFSTWMLRSEENVKDAIKNRPASAFDSKLHHRHRQGNRGSRSSEEIV